MAPPTTTPRLPDLDPEQLAQYAESRVAELIDLVDWATGFDLKGMDPPYTMSPLATFVTMLVQYAKDGVQYSNSPLRLVERVKATLDAVRSEPGELEAPLRVGLDAAHARALMVTGLPVPRPFLAALAGVNERRLRQVIASRELKAPAEGTVPAKAAMAWLKSRAVPGFAE